VERTGARHLLGVALVGAIALLALGLAQTSGGGSVLRDAGVTSAPERYTELAFAHPARLPDQLRARRALLRIPFTLHNVGDAPRRYAWSVTSSADGPAGLAQGAVRAAPDERLRLDPRVRLSCTRGRVRVAVRLADPALTIGFWARCPALGEASPSA
jgi:hypothetical protein